MSKKVETNNVGTRVVEDQVEDVLNKYDTLESDDFYEDYSRMDDGFLTLSHSMSDYEYDVEFKQFVYESGETVVTFDLETECPWNLIFTEADKRRILRNVQENKTEDTGKFVWERNRERLVIEVALVDDTFDMRKVEMLLRTMKQLVEGAEFHVSDTYFEDVDPTVPLNEELVGRYE